MRAALILLFGWLMSLSGPARAVESYYLYLPPIMGSASMPGYSGLIPISSFAFGVASAGGGVDELHFTKPVDGTSPAFFSAVVSGTHFPIGDLLLYASGATEPYLTFQMVDPSVSSDTRGGEVPTESISIHFSSGGYVQAVPEPSTAGLMLFGFLATAGLAAKRKSTLPRSRDRSERAIDCF